MELKNGDVGNELTVSTTTEEGGELECSLLIFCSIEMYTDTHLEPLDSLSHTNVRAPGPRWLSLMLSMKKGRCMVEVGEHKVRMERR